MTNTNTNSNTDKKINSGNIFTDIIILALVACVLYISWKALTARREEKIQEYRSQMIGNDYSDNNINVTILDEKTLTYTSEEFTEPTEMEYEITVGAITGIIRIDVNGGSYPIYLDKDGTVSYIKFEKIEFFD